MTTYDIIPVSNLVMADCSQKGAEMKQSEKITAIYCRSRVTMSLPVNQIQYPIKKVLSRSFAGITVSIICNILLMTAIRVQTSTAPRGQSFSTKLKAVKSGL